MKYSFKEHEKNFIEWCKAGYAVALSEPQKLKVRDFLKNIDDPNFVPPLYRHQAESVKRIIYSYEILGKKDLLVEVVTGGGKSAIIAGIIAYFMIVHNVNKFLILVPNTIVRSRLKDEFDPESKTFVYNTFRFFSNGTEDLAARISLHTMEVGKDPTGIRQANIILGNIETVARLQNILFGRHLLFGAKSWQKPNLMVGSGGTETWKVLLVKLDVV
jgi:hypothetical protein